MKKAEGADESPLSEASPDQTAQQLSSVIGHLQQLRERERVDLSRALHDDLGGLLVSAVMDLGWIEKHQPTEHLRERLQRVRTTLRAAIDLKRNLIEGLRPSLLDNFGLFAAFRWHVKHSCSNVGVPTTEEYPGEELPFRPDVGATLFRIMQEALGAFLIEEALAHVAVTVAVSSSDILFAIAHRHETFERIDLMQDCAIEMATIAQRVGSCGGRIEMQRDAVGSAMTMTFPLHRVLA